MTSVDDTRPPRRRWPTLTRWTRRPGCDSSTEEDAKVAAAVGLEIPQIARAVQRAAHSFRVGGRLIYVGAGTSGRLGRLDASECPPTFGVPPDWVQGFIAGGPGAMFRAVEGAEDDPDLGAAAIIEADVSENDTVIGISASGRAPFVLGALAAGEGARRGDRLPRQQPALGD